MDGFALAARFSLATNRRNFCGPTGAEATLYRAITEGSGRAATEDALARFEALYPYLAALGRRHGRDPFDLDVVEAYWIGNPLLDAFGRAEFRPILDALVERGLPRFVARELDDALPEGAIPHHVFHVAFVGVGAVTGHVPTTLPNLEACRPAWATVTEVGARSLRVEGPVLALKNGRLTLDRKETRSAEYDPKVVPDLHEGDVVALHWGWTALRLAPEQHRHLVEYTERSLSAANAALRPGLAAPERSAATG
jgi:Family of unknown function (DUF6390)